MWSDKLLAAVMQKGYSASWPARMKEAFDEIYGSSGGRYPGNAKDLVDVRAPERQGSTDDIGVPFAALIHPKNPKSGPYGGMSIAIFPGDDESPSLLSFVVGTNGLAPDEAILGRPGHARKVKAICAWLNRKYGEKSLRAWSKQEPSRIDQPIPDNTATLFPQYSRAFNRYGNVLYGIFVPNDDDSAREALTAFFDLMFEERGVLPLAAFREESARIKQEWLECLLPEATEQNVLELLNTRRYVILQGPPGTGKTRMARQLIRNHYAGQGRTIQFHANTTYEDFVGGLAPLDGKGDLGFRFAPKKGHLILAAEEAEKESKPYLLHIDEINRADMSKVLGEAIYLLEADDKTPREITLSYDFGNPFKSQLRLPENLHIIGTMNSADRSLAVVDVALRRRFAFKKMWPQMAVVREGGCETMQRAFQDLVSIFVEYATDDTFDLMPGHSYFLETDDATARKRLKVTLEPLLDEYLAQGYVSPFAEPLRSYLQRIDSL